MGNEVTYTGNLMLGDSTPDAPSSNNKVLIEINGQLVAVEKSEDLIRAEAQQKRGKIEEQNFRDVGTLEIIYSSS